MGQNLALNIADKGFTIAVHNRPPSKVVDAAASMAASSADSGPGSGMAASQFLWIIVRVRWAKLP